MLSMMMPRNRGIQSGWNHIAVAGCHKARAAPVKTHMGKALARLRKTLSMEFTYSTSKNVSRP